MSGERTVLVMAGAREAHALVARLVGRNRRVIASLPEPERMFGPPFVPTRTGAFENERALTAWAREQGAQVIMDASHAFDETVSAMAREAAKALGLPYLRLLRPPWQATAKDDWTHVPTIDEAARIIPHGARAFTNTGWTSLPAFASFPGEKLFVRQTSQVPRDKPFPFVEVVAGEPPFSQFQEEDLFRRLRVTHLVCRNTGGAASMSKLLAARAMALPVIMVERVRQNGTYDCVETVGDALAWEAEL